MKTAWLWGLFFSLSFAIVSCGDDDSTSTENGTEDGDITTDGDEITDDDDDSTTPTRIARPDSTTVEFGGVMLGDSKTAKATIFNDGNEALHLLSLEWENDTQAIFAAVTDFTDSIAVQPGQGTDIEFSFSPQNQVDYSQVVTVVNDSVNLNRVDLTLNGSGTPLPAVGELGVDKESVDFGPKPIAGNPTPIRVSFGNTGEEGSIVYVTSIKLANDDENNPFFLEMGSFPTEENPLELQAGPGTYFDIKFQPPGVMPYTDTILFDWYTDTNELVQSIQVPVTGEGTWGVLKCTPYPINFGTVFIDESSEIQISLGNTTEETIGISGIMLTDIPDHDTKFTLTGDTSGQVDPGTSHVISLEYHPLQSEEINGTLQVFTGAGTLYFPIMANSEEGNIPPVARVALEDHGADISRTIEKQNGESVTLYGGISNDPDGNSANLTFAWSLTKPESSSTQLSSTTASTVTLGFDAQGFYNVTLVVTDENGAQSQPKTVTISVGGMSQMIMLTMDYSGTGATNVALGWKLPAGFVCDEDTASAGRCIVPEGNGSLLIESTGSAAGGTHESISHADPPAGQYEIRVKLVEDCSGTNFLDPTCMLFGSENPDVTLKIFIDDMVEAEYTYHFNLSDIGETRRWNIANSGGNWTAPQEVN